MTGLPLYVGVPSNNAIAQHMAAQLQAHHSAQVSSGVAVQALERVGGGCGCGSGGSKWQLRGSRKGRAAAAEPEPAEQQEELGAFDAVVLADAMPLLPGGRVGQVAFLCCVFPGLHYPELHSNAGHDVLQSCLHAVLGRCIGCRVCSKLPLS